MKPFPYRAICHFMHRAGSLASVRWRWAGPTPAASECAASPGIGGRTQPAARVVCRAEVLEARSLFSTTPMLAGIELLGAVSSVKSIVLTFTAPLDPVSSQQVTSYSFGKRDPATDNSGFDFGSLFGFRVVGHRKADRTTLKLVKNGKIQFSSAVYDPTADTVTLTPLAPFKATAYFKFLRLHAKGTYVLKDASGAALNGGVDEVYNWIQRQGKLIRFTDAVGDHITFKLHGHGKLDIFTRASKNANPIVFIDGADGTTSVTGSVKYLHGLPGPIEISELAGAAQVANNLTGNPTFTVYHTYD